MSEPRCGNCRHFIDYTDPADAPEDLNGYCGYLVDVLGLHEALKVNEYGGHWTHSDDCCDFWTEGPSLWQRQDS